MNINCESYKRLGICNNIDYDKLGLESENEHLKEILQKICFVKNDNLMIKDKIEIDNINDIYFLKKFVFNKQEKTLFD